jgi:hypothetical protein
MNLFGACDGTGAINVQRLNLRRADAASLDQRARRLSD